MRGGTNDSFGREHVDKIELSIRDPSHKMAIARPR